MNQNLALIAIANFRTYLVEGIFEGKYLCGRYVPV